MNLIIDDLMVEQIGHEKHMKAILKQIEKKNEELHKGTSVAEERQKIRDAKADGLQEPKLKKTEELKAELKSMWESVRNIKKILQLKRNKYCVYCAFQLHDPEFPQDQIGITYANADFKGVQGYRRYDALFHTECFVAWYANKFHLDDKEMQYVQPKLTGQKTIFSSIEDQKMNLLDEIKSDEKCTECGEWFGDHLDDCKAVN